MATEEQNNLNKPLIVFYRPPDFGISLQPWLQPCLQSRFSLIDPFLPSQAQAKACDQSVRVLVSVDPSPLTAKVLERYPLVELVVAASVGISHIDIDECRRRNIRVTNAGDAFSEDVADNAVGLFLDVVRNVTAYDRFVRAGSWHAKGEYPLTSKVSVSVRCKTKLGSMGMKFINDFLICVDGGENP